MSENRTISPIIYTVSQQDLVDLWVDSLHPNDHLLLIWDARRHINLLRDLGFLVDEEKTYNNKVLTVELDNVTDALDVMDMISTHEDGPFIQVYSNGKLITDNIDSEYNTIY